MLQLRFQHFFPSVYSFYHPITNSISVDGFWAPILHKFVCFCKIGTLCELVCEHLFFFQQNSCFSLSFIGNENFFASTRITYANVSKKSMNSFAHNPWTFPKHLLAFISPDYRSRISKKCLDFSFFLNKNFFTKKELLQSFLNPAEWMIANI